MTPEDDETIVCSTRPLLTREKIEAAVEAVVEKLFGGWASLLQPCDGFEGRLGEPWDRPAVVELFRREFGIGPAGGSK